MINSTTMTNRKLRTARDPSRLSDREIDVFLFHQSLSPLLPPLQFEGNATNIRFTRLISFAHESPMKIQKISLTSVGN